MNKFLRGIINRAREYSLRWISCENMKVSFERADGKTLIDKSATDSRISRVGLD